MSRRLFRLRDAHRDKIDEAKERLLHKLWKVEGLNFGCTVNASNIYITVSTMVMAQKIKDTGILDSQEKFQGFQVEFVVAGKSLPIP